MEGEEMAIGESKPMETEVEAEETVRTSASATGLGGQAPTGVGPPLPLRVSLPGDGQHGPLDGPRTSTATQSTPAQASPHSEWSCRRGKSTLPQLREEAILQQPLWLLAGPMPILRPMRTVHLRPTLPPPNHLTLLWSMSVRHSFIRINMRNNRSPIHSTHSQQPPIPTPFLLGDPHDQADHLLLPQCNLWHRTHMQRVWIRWRFELIAISMLS